MRLNKKLQLGLLFALYLSRSGKTTIDSAAEGLKVSKPFLEQVARLLRIAGVVRSTRGAAGGYELCGEPLVSDVFNALSPVSLLSKADRMKNSTGAFEDRALNHLSFNLTAALTPILQRKVKSIGMDIVAGDTAKLNRLAVTARAN